MRTSQNRACYFTLSEAEVASLLHGTTSFRDRTVLRVLYLTGLRRQELCGLNAEDLDLARSRLIVRAGKGDKSRVVPLSESLVADLRAILGRRTKGPVFCSQKGGRLSPRAVNYIVEGAGRAAGIVNPNPARSAINPHLLRHTFARHYLKHGGRMHLLSQILGHADVGITHAVYGTASEDEIQSEYTSVVRALDS